MKPEDENSNSCALNINRDAPGCKLRVTFDLQTGVSIAGFSIPALSYVDSFIY